MILKNFSYDGQLLSEYNCIICYLDGDNSNTIPNGSVLTLNTITSKSTYENVIIDVSYDVISMTFSIMKNNCQNQDDDYFSAQEIANINKWLNRKLYHKFIPEYDKDIDDVIFYYGTFTTIENIYIGSNIIGFNLTFTTNAPWGFVNHYIKKNNITQLYVPNDSDDIGILYPTKFNVKILNGTNSTLKITNNSDLAHITTISKCNKNELIEMDCKNKIIQSSNHSTLYNDFNYKFPRLKNTYINSKNIIDFSLPCDVEIEYRVVRKVGIIV